MTLELVTMENILSYYVIADNSVILGYQAILFYLIKSSWYTVSYFLKMTLFLCETYNYIILP